MPSSHTSSPSSAPCRLDLRPSRQLGALLILLVVLAVSATWMSALPWWQALPLSAMAAAYGAWCWWRDHHAPVQVLVVPWDALHAVTIDAQPLHDFNVTWRGPLASLSWSQAGHGGVRRRLLWPDVLPQAARRELRLAAQARAVSPQPRSMAP